MIASLTLVLFGSQCHRSNEVVWTKGFTFHHSQQLSSGLVLLTEAGFYSQGNRDRVRLTWFRHTASGFKNLLAFEGMATLDDLSPKVQGDWVRLRTVDEPHVLMVSAGDDTFGRDWTWHVENGIPRLVSRNVLAVRLRAVDQAIWRSWSARHPSLLQRNLRKAWPEPDDFFSWTEKRNGATWTVTLDRDFIFTLRQVGTGEWKVVDFRTARKTG